MPVLDAPSDPTHPPRGIDRPLMPARIFRGRGRRLMLFTPLILIVHAAGAPAATWRQVTPSGGTNIEEVGLARTSDGVLHLAWVQKDAGDPTSQDIATRSLNPAGDALGRVSLIAARWAALSNPALTLAPGGIRALFGGIRTSSANEPNDDLNTATSADGGNSWALQIGNASNGPSAYASSVGATVLSNLTPVTAWGSSSGTFTAVGTAPGPVYDLQGQLGGDFGYDPGLVTSSAGVPYVAWASNASGRSGVWAQPLQPNGTPAAPPHLMPGILAGGFSQQLQRTPVAARAGGGVYVAYPGGYPASTRVVLWRVGDAGSRVIAQAPGDHHATVSATGDGRIWVVWSDTHGHVYASRSNRSANTFGAVVSTRAPGSGSIYSLDASAAPDGSIDVFALTDAGHSETFQTHLLPGLTVRATPNRLRPGRATAVTFTVSDAGDPVRGSVVTALGRTAKTAASGRVTMTLRPRRRFTVRATRVGYLAGRLGLSLAR
ncbi:MAG TPA: hypothetical protein VG325_12230 [Solirubrobacteraceae bacterium]|nr:hypothetical protein [Solirubrobacteraceae bacterium]